MKASRITALGLVAAATLWILSGHLLPRETAESSAAIRTNEAAGTKLFRFRDLNQHDPATGNSPFASPINVVNQFESTSSSRYNSLQVTWKLRNLRGFNSQLTWTWSHSIDNASDGEDFVPNAAQPDNSLNPGAEKGSSNFDARHRLTWMFGYTLPNFAMAKSLTNGWSINGLLRLSKNPTERVAGKAGLRRR